MGARRQGARSGHGGEWRVTKEEAGGIGGIIEDKRCLDDDNREEDNGGGNGSTAAGSTGAVMKASGG